VVTRQVANRLGIGSVIVIAIFWLLVLNPFGWQGFPGDTIVSELAVLAAILGSAVAFFKVSRWRSISIVASILTFVAVQYALR
jgi:hypothetical protein